MSQSLCILGRQPALGLAELESLYGSEALQPVSDNAVLLDKVPEVVDFARLGGSMKLAQVLTTLDTNSWPEIEKYLINTVPQHLDYLPEGKLQLGLSVYGLPVRAQQLLASGLKLKKVIKNAGRSVRLIPNKEPALNSAQVLHNNLTGPLGWELLFVRHGTQTILAQTVAEQDIEAYAKRDQNRPKRDARVGMLPPKLAQIMVNMAVIDTNPPHGAILLDPFCGTGVVLQEAQLIGFDVYGTDLEPRMVDYSTQNLEWLHRTHRPASNFYLVEQGDATAYKWTNADAVHFVASETYLGRPLSSLPSPGDLQRIVQDVNTIHKKFLRNLERQTKPGLRLCLAVPAWKTKSSFMRLPCLDQLSELGYTRVSFVHARTEELTYHRPGQIVARELVVLIRK